MLQAFGFPEFLCRWIKVLFKDSSTIIDVNDNLSSSIPLGRSIRQGFPITPTLFFIVDDALFYVLIEPSLGPPMKGLLLSNNDYLLISHADDTSLFLELEELNFCDALDRLEVFFLASGAKIAPHKSLVLGWSNSPPNWV